MTPNRRIRFKIGDDLNSGGSFTIRELIISDGSLYNTKDADFNC